jgi:hypothetical protein
MTTDTPNEAKNPAKTESLMPSYLAAIVLIIGSAADAIALYSLPTYRSNLLFVFVFAFLAYVLGQTIVKRRAK